MNTRWQFSRFWWQKPLSFRQQPPAIQELSEIAGMYYGLARCLDHLLEDTEADDIAVHAFSILRDGWLAALKKNLEHAAYGKEGPQSWYIGWCKRFTNTITTMIRRMPLPEGEICFNYTDDITKLFSPVNSNRIGEVVSITVILDHARDQLEYYYPQKYMPVDCVGGLHANRDSSSLVNGRHLEFILSITGNTQHSRRKVMAAIWAATLVAVSAAVGVGLYFWIPAHVTSTISTLYNAKKVEIFHDQLCHEAQKSFIIGLPFFFGGHDDMKSRDTHIAANLTMLSLIRRLFRSKTSRLTPHLILAVQRFDDRIADLMRTSSSETGWRTLLRRRQELLLALLDAQNTDYALELNERIQPYESHIEERVRQIEERKKKLFEKYPHIQVELERRVEALQRRSVDPSTTASWLYIWGMDDAITAELVTDIQKTLGLQGNNIQGFNAETLNRVLNTPSHSGWRELEDPSSNLEVCLTTLGLLVLRCGYRNPLLHITHFDCTIRSSGENRATAVHTTSSLAFIMNFRQMKVTLEGVLEGVQIDLSRVNVICSGKQPMAEIEGAPFNYFQHFHNQPLTAEVMSNWLKRMVEGKISMRIRQASLLRNLVLPLLPSLVILSQDIENMQIQTLKRVTDEIYSQAETLLCTLLQISDQPINFGEKQEAYRNTVINVVQTNLLTPLAILRYDHIRHQLFSEFDVGNVLTPQALEDDTSL